MNRAKVTIAQAAAFEMRLALPAEMDATGCALHVHTSSDLFNPCSTLRALASVCRIFVHPPKHSDAVFVVLTKLAAEQTRM